MVSKDNLSQFSTLVKILARLRATDGCPWDREQTHQSLRKNLLEESYEVLDALDSQDAVKLRGELGDLLMQIIFHAQIAEEEKQFSINDVIHDINIKLIRRHPHIFGDVKVTSSAEVAHNWEEIKRGEREVGASILSGVPQQLPALNSSQSIQRRVAQVGFDWKNVGGVLDKLVEEINEIKAASNQEEKVSEFGDLLFTLVNLARHLNIDAESALRETNQRFRSRFTYMEKLAHERGLNLSRLSLEELDKLWEEAKQGVKRH